MPVAKHMRIVFLRFKAQALIIIREIYWLISYISY
nr:MAG TPA: hypothetical protein [Caudoviricetes sp.]